LLKLWCAGKLGNCPASVKRFRFTCLYCRIRRQFYGKFTNPSYWINYTYKSNYKVYYVDGFVRDGVKYEASGGGKIKKVDFTTVLIDPRGRFTMLRCAAIMVLDRIMAAVGLHKPLEELCEFLANYPT
jgi:hypothetical protein